MAALNDAGEGPRSQPSGIVYQTCSQGEFLATHLLLTNPEQVVCLPCPAGAFCQGLPSPNVTASSGFWRVPWSVHGLLFEPCPESSVCRGIDLDSTDSEQRSSNASATFMRRLLQGDSVTEPALRHDAGGYQRQLLQQAAELAELVQARQYLAKYQGRPGNYTESGLVRTVLLDAENHTSVEVAGRIRQELQLAMQPGSSQGLTSDTVLNNLVVEEGCIEGHTGVLCTECQLGWARSGTYLCRQCASREFIIVLACVVAVVILAAIGIVIRGTLTSGKSSQNKVEIMVVKIAFSHLQTVALAASFELAWPDSIVRYFDFVDTASSVSPNIVSIDCLIPQSGGEDGQRTFFLTSSAVLLAPFVLVLLISCFWVGRYAFINMCTADATKTVAEASVNMTAASRLQRDAIDLQHVTVESNPLHAAIKSRKDRRKVRPPPKRPSRVRTDESRPEGAISMETVMQLASETAERLAQGRWQGDRQGSNS